MSHPLPVVAVLIGPRNAELVLGLPWRWVRDHAPALGVPFVGAGRKRAVRADLLIAALERAQRKPEPTDPREAIRRACGLERVDR